MTPINLSSLKTLFDHMRGRVTYLLGAKAPSLDCDSSVIHQIDCSGWTKYAVSKATNGAVVLPDGSQAQLAWAEKNLHKLAQYSDVNTYGGGKRLFLCFLRVTPDRPIGHVWFVTGKPAMTMESHGHLTGVSSRAYDTPVLAEAEAFELPTV